MSHDGKEVYVNLKDTIPSENTKKKKKPKSKSKKVQKKGKNNV